MPPVNKVNQKLGNVFEIAEDLLGQFGEMSPDKIEKLSAGSNNRTYHVMTNRADYVLKVYFHHPNDPRDRLRNETAFLAYAWSCGVRQIPQLYAKNESFGAALFEYIPGRPVALTDIDQNKLEQTADFINSINPNSNDEADIPYASESCFGWAAHVELINNRLNQLLSLSGKDEATGDMQEFLNSRVSPAFARVCDRAAQAGLLEDQERVICVSPSDFGFHNTLIRTDGSLCFLDFEYAGRDDPCKLIADFFCQPKVPVPFNFFEGFRQKVQSSLGLQAVSDLELRCYLQLYQVKWMCIVLNVFSKLGHQRRDFSEDVIEDRRAQQLKSAASIWQAWSDAGRL